MTQPAVESDRSADERPRRQLHSGYGVPIVAALFLLPVLYVLSIGPAYWLLCRGQLSGETLHFVYRPVERAGEDHRPISHFLVWYIELWVPGWFDPIVTEPVFFPSATVPAPEPR